MKTKLLYITIFSLLITQACKRDNTDSGCPSYSTSYKTLTLDAINQTPYFTNTAFDTISFASDKGDTITFVKTKTDTSWYCENDNSNADCPKENANCYQVLHNSYLTLKGIGTFDIKHSKKGYKFSNGIEVTINNVVFLYGDQQVGYNGYWTYKKNISLKNKIYHDLMVIYPNSYDSLVAESFINKEYGLFYFNDRIENINYTIIR